MDFQKRLKEGTIEKCTIPASFLANALVERRQKDEYLDTILLSSCYIDGPLIINNKEVFRAFVVENSCFGDKIEWDKTIFHETISFTVVVIDDLTAKSTTFGNGLAFEYCHLLQSADFEGAKFQAASSFRHTTFDNMEGIVNTDTNFRNATFSSIVDFDKSEFKSLVYFDDTTFAGGVLFSGASFFGDVEFRGTKFGDTVSFQRAGIAGVMQFKRVSFPTLATFDEMHGLRSSKVNEHIELSFCGVTFHGVTSFDELDVDELSFPIYSPHFESEVFSPLICEKPISFYKLRCQTANFSGAEFRDSADFGRATVALGLWLNNVTFREGVNFAEAVFPNAERESVLGIEKVRFVKPIRMEWNQIAQTHLTTADEETWDILEHAFKASGNLEGQNESYYRKRQISRKTLTDWISYAFWGFGVRPWRLLLWIGAVQLLFTAIYWTQTEKLAKGKAPWPGQMARIRFAIDFGRRTAITLGYGVQNSRTLLFQILTTLHSLVLKALFVLFFVAVSNVSPLLHDLLGKLLPLG